MPEEPAPASATSSHPVHSHATSLADALTDDPPATPGNDPLLDALRRTFGHQQFREGQREIVEAVLRGDDVLAVMPTGAGKSLLYQLPALLLPGTLIAVSPLISLMKDQVDKLRARGLPAIVLNSSQSHAAAEAAIQELASGRAKLLYVAPERFRSARFQALLSRVQVSRFAIDEAHCLSEWGHDFRPDYLRLGEAAEACGRPPIVAVTATATRHVRDDIVSGLDLSPRHRSFVRGFDRPNLRFAVVPASGEAEKLDAVASAVAAARGPAIVYGSTRRSVERIAQALAARLREPVAVYHAGLGPDERRAAQDRFFQGGARVVVATNAFGLGIDKGDVRAVVHHDLPGSVEAYYQEAGRAGRDGAPADVTLVFSGQDVHLQTYFIDGDHPEARLLEAVRAALVRATEAGRNATLDSLKAAADRALPGKDRGASDRAIEAALRLLADAGHAARAPDTPSWAAQDGLDAPLRVDLARLDRLRAAERSRLRALVGYARGHVCRRRAILRYFGVDAPERAAGGTRCCDLCDAPVALVPEDEAHVIARKVLSCVARLRGRFGRTLVAKVLAGVPGGPVAERGLDRLPTFGALRPWTEPQAALAIDACVERGLLEVRTEDGRYPKVDLTPLGVSVLKDEARAGIALALPASRPKAGARSRRAGRDAKAPAAPAPTTAATPGDERAFERLRAWRTTVARERGVPPYVVFHDRTLRAIVERKPADEQELASVKGIGPAKLEAYGKALLECLGDPAPHGAAAE